MATSRENTFQCNDVRLVTIALDQIVVLYNEHNTDVMTNQKAIDLYLDINFKGGVSFVKCIGTHGSHGSVNYFVGRYSSLYVMYKVLRIISTSVMARRYVNLEISHIH